MAAFSSVLYILPFLFVNTCYVCLYKLISFFIYCFSFLSLFVRTKDGVACCTEASFVKGVSGDY